MLVVPTRKALARVEVVVLVLDLLQTLGHERPRILPVVTRDTFQEGKRRLLVTAGVSWERSTSLKSASRSASMCRRVPVTANKRRAVRSVVC
jgi:hypothetical protein